MLRPAGQEALQDTRRCALSDCDASRHADNIGNLTLTQVKEIVGGAKQSLSCRNIEIEKPRQWQVNRLNLIQVDTIVETAKFVEIRLRQRHWRVGTQCRPFLTRKAAERRDFLDQFFHRQSFGRAAFSAMPLTPWRRASSAITSASLTSVASNITKRW